MRHSCATPGLRQSAAARGQGSASPQLAARIAASHILSLRAAEQPAEAARRFGVQPSRRGARRTRRREGCPRFPRPGDRTRSAARRIRARASARGAGSASPRQCLRNVPWRDARRDRAFALTGIRAAVMAPNLMESRSCCYRDAKKSKTKKNLNHPRQGRRTPGANAK